MFLTLDEHCEFLKSQIALKPVSVRISTFGLYAGILDDGRDTAEWGKRYISKTRGVIDAMSEVQDVRILLGIPAFFSCKGALHCEDCKTKYLKQLRRHVRHQRKWSQFDWRFSRESHLKSYLFFFKDRVTGVAGGRNLVDSEWTDVTFPLDKQQISRILPMIDAEWATAQPLNAETMKTVVDSLEARFSYEN